MFHGMSFPFVDVVLNSVSETKKGKEGRTQILDSLGGKSTLVTEVTIETRQSEVVALVSRRIWEIRSSTQPAERRASASWSQHSSIVSHNVSRP